MNEKREKQISLRGILRRLLVCAVFASMLLPSISVYGQNIITITGNVVSESDQLPLPGVNVIVKGTNNGTITNLNGEFTIDVNQGATLLFTIIGFTEKEIVVNEQTKINVSLVEAISEFDEVVVVGYGVQQKKLITGATVQVKGDNLVKTSTSNVLEAIQGQTAGVQITSNSGQPGEGMKVNIRGVGTIGNSGPLYLVDGVQTGDISYLNNSDIESIDILKDAASSAIYGSQAANGVILITTKTGSEGKMNITFDSYIGIQSRERKIRTLNSQEYAVIMNEAAINVGKLPYFTQDSINKMGNGTDWLDEMFYDNAVTQNYALGFNGGSQKSVYSVSMSYTDQNGIVGGPSVSNYKRYGFRLNTEHKLYKDIIKVGQHLTFSYIEKNGIGVGGQYSNSLRGAFGTSPFLPVYDDAGNYLDNSKDAQDVMYNGQPYSPWNSSENNPYATMMLNNQSKNNNQKIFGDVYLGITPIKGLTFLSRVGVDYYVSENRSYKPIYQLSDYDRSTRDNANQSMSKGIALTWDNTLTYNMKFGDHAITTMIGTSAYRNSGSWVSASNANLVFPDLDHAYVNNATNTNLSNIGYGGAPFEESMLLSYFGRASYNFKETYMLNATFRADGSSKFAEKNRWGYFPSVSAGWVLSNESFFEGTKSFVDFFKLRASWGQVGNQSIAAYQYLAPIQTSNSYYYFGTDDYDPSGNTNGAYPSRLPNEDVKWETSEQINLGFDGRFIDSKLGVNFDYYIKTTKDWLLVKPGFATDGADSPYFNGGTVKNNGIELVVNWNDNVGDLQYNIGVNFAYNKNEVTDVPTEDGIVHGATNVLYDNSGEFYHRAETGIPVGYFWGWQTDGVFQNETEVLDYLHNEKMIQPNAKPGDLRYKDLNNDGIINDKDKTMVGDPNPDFYYGFNLGLNYKGLDFSVLANGVAGNQIVQSYRNQANAKANYTTAILDRWHGEGTSNTVPRVTETNVNNQFSDIFIKEGDFLRITNITLGYDFSKLTGDKVFKQLRLYAAVQNAITFTKYDGMDPEVGFGNRDANNSSDGSSGIDVGFYPRPRTYLLGVSVKF